MKKKLLSTILLFTLMSAIFLIVPEISHGSSLSLISSDSYEKTSFHGPDPPFTPFDPSNPSSYSIDGAIEGLIGTVLDWSGNSTIGNIYIYGPGISRWDNYFRIRSDKGISAMTSAVGGVASYGLGISDIFDLPYFKSQYFTDEWHWASIFELSGDPGESAKISLDYKHDYTYFNLAVAGKSRAETSLLYGAYIIPSGQTGNYSQDAADNYGYGGGALPADAIFNDELRLKDGATYEYLGGFEEVTESVTGSMDLGSMSVGDRLYLYGYLGAYTECEAYLPGMTVATMFPSFEGTLNIEPITNPVPEPATMLLFGIGLLGVAGVSRKKK